MVRNERRKERAIAAKAELEKLFLYRSFHEQISVIPDKRNGYKVRIVTFSDFPPPFEVPKEINGIEIVRHETKMLRPR